MGDREETTLGSIFESIRILDEAERDLAEGRRFYEQQRPGLGAYFLDSLFSDIDSVLARSHAILGMLRNRSNIMRHQNTPVDNARERGIPKPPRVRFQLRRRR